MSSETPVTSAAPLSTIVTHQDQAGPGKNTLETSGEDTNTHKKTTLN